MAHISYNHKGTIKYARIRHFSHNDAITHKPQFTYCKIDDLEALKPLLKSQNISLPIEKAESGLIGQDLIAKSHDLTEPKGSLIQKIHAAVV